MPNRFGRSSSKSGPHREKSRVIAFSRSVKKADQRRQKRGRASGGALVDASREYQAVTASRDQSSCPSCNYPHGRPSEQTPQGRLKLIVAPCYRSTAMRACIAIVFLLLVVPGWALDLVIKDGDTLTLDGTEFRLDGIDAPEKDQVPRRSPTPFASVSWKERG